MRKAFVGGRDSVEATMRCEPWGDMEEYASIRIKTSFKTFLHENYHEKGK
jgi:hypothetical protein